MAGTSTGTVKFVPNPRARALLAQTPQMVAYLKMLADAGAEEARAIAPVMTGSYRDSITGEAGVEGSTAKGRINAADFKALWIEFGTRMWPAHATLRRGAEGSGLAVRTKAKP